MTGPDKRKQALEREARVAGLRDFQTPTLEAVERRRWQLLGFAVFFILAFAGGMTILSTEAGLIHRYLVFMPLYAIRILFLGLAALIGFYLFDKESRLRNVTRALVDERVLSAALSNRLKEISVLSEVGKVINQILDLQDVLSIVLRSALDLLEAHEGSIMLLDETGQSLVVACSISKDQGFLDGSQVQLGKGVAGWVAQHREPLLITGKAKPDFFEELGVSSRSIASSVSVPLIGDGELFGVLNVNDMTGEREFTEYDLRAVGLFAEHAALAIRNARLFEKERQMVQKMAEVDRMKTDFIGTISHELRTPLTSIIGCARTIRRRASLLENNQRDEFLLMIERQSEKLLRMVEEVLSASKIESGSTELRREPIDLVSLIKDVVGTFETAGATHSLVVEAPVSLASYGDLDAIEQIVTNLVGNAMKYSRPDSTVLLRLSDGPGAATLEVIDEGFGIPPSQLPTIFDRFRQLEPSTTRRAGGVGLGLYIVKNLLEESGGTISVASEEGRGTTFTVVFPKRRESGSGQDTRGR